MKRLLWAVLLAAPVCAQNWQLGAAVGGGVIGVEGSTTPAVAFGAEFCGLCSGRFAFFVDYSHLESLGESRRLGVINRFDLMAGGLRIQGGKRVRPFFDIGAAYGIDTFRSWVGSDAHGNRGLVLAGGATISLRERLYARPQFRLYALRGLHAVAAGMVGIGVRF